MPNLTPGPILFDLGADHVQLWARTDGPAALHVVCTPLDVGEPVIFPAVTTDAASDYTAAILIAGLTPGTVYQAELSVDGVAAGLRQFTTLPAEGDPAELRLAFVSDTFRAYPAPALGALRALWPMGVFVIGDHDHTNYLSNTSTATGALMKARNAHRCLRDDSTELGADVCEFIIDAGVPILGHIADDHDCGADNRNKSGKWWPEVLQAMREYWPVSADHGYLEGYMYSSVRIGRTIVALLDTRTHRDTPGTHKKLLGDEQWEWLGGVVDEVGAGQTFDRLVLVSPVPVNPLQHKLDSWFGYTDERVRLVEMLAPIVGRVVVVSGDCHWGSIALPPIVALPEINIPKLQEQGFANTCNNAAPQWTLNSLTPGGGFGLLTINPAAVLVEIYNADGSLRLSATVPLV